MEEEIVQELKKEGFFEVKILRARNPSKTFQFFYLNWLKKKPTKVLRYLENTEAKFYLEKIFPETKSIIVSLFPYLVNENEKLLKKTRYKIALYAWGLDYHKVLKQKFSKVLKKFGLKENEFRIVVDSTPLNERYYARISNLGFIGRNGMLIHEKAGSYFFIAMALLSKKLKGAKSQSIDIEQDIQRMCGECNLCVKSCPTHALIGDGTMKAELCLSYLTIENRDEKLTFPEKSKRHRWIFGCDICQKVCPYNKNPLYTNAVEFKAQAVIHTISRGDLSFSNKQLKKTALSRSGKKILARNIEAVENLFKTPN